jgi:hypothetical protein
MEPSPKRRHAAFRRAPLRATYGFVALLLSLAPACRGGTWSAAEQKEFFAICGGGVGDPSCQCLARELPKRITFKAYASVVTASKAMAPDRLDDAVLKHLAHAAVVCAQR